MGREGFRLNCDNVSGLLDRLMDDDLSEAERLELEAHAKACPACGASIHAAMQMKALFDEMPTEADVPLKAQAAWRSAIRQEAAGKRRKQMMRRITAAAAAVVVLVGAGLALNTSRMSARDAAGSAMLSAVQPTAMPEAASPEKGQADMELSLSDSAVVEADGMAMPMMAMEEAMEAEVGAPMMELSIVVEDIDVARKLIRDAAREYEGEADEQVLEQGGANLYINLPAENTSDFLSAIAHIDVSGQEWPALPDIKSGFASILLSVKQQ